MGLEFLEGNEAVARAAQRAGCTFFAGYPITPASSILHYMLKVAPSLGGVAIQAEDEIASIGFCIGAAMAGQKAMTATSGPGISLYSENIGLAIIGETPLVIVNVQRQGPATGSATKGAEGDIMFTRWGTSGGLPIIALSPATVEETYELTYRAFNLAEHYRTPVFLLSNKELGLTRETVNIEGMELPERIERKRYSGEDSYRPHAFESAEQVPDISDFGGEHIARYTTSTHDQSAYLSTDPGVTGDMIEHYVAKIENAHDEIALVKEDFQAGAKTLFVSYGIVSRSVRVAVDVLRANGQKVSSLVIQSLFPVPKARILAALENVDKVVVPEMNMGQYLVEVERLVRGKVEVVGVNKMDTTLLSPREIILRAGLA